jgi:hypothetical protein
MLENDTDNDKSIHRKQNHRIENMSISIDNGTFENIETMNGHICIMFTTK